MYTAIIVEPRKHAALSYVLNNILTNLSGDWNIVICHGTQNLEYIQNILTSELQNFLNRVTLVNLGVENLNIYQYNDLLCSKKFYKYIPTETFLVFQTDTIILPQNAHLISEFLEYDYVGAPWKHAGDIGNGGFSLRKKTKMLEIIENAKLYNYGEAEDAFFSQAKGRVLNNPSIRIYKPTFEKAKQFSVETVFYEQPFGCHAPWKHTPEFVKLHPEVQKLESLQFSI
jgi:hypothetical protein